MTKVQSYIFYQTKRRYLRRSRARETDPSPPCRRHSHRTSAQHLPIKQKNITVTKNFNDSNVFFSECVLSPRHFSRSSICGCRSFYHLGDQHNLCRLDDQHSSCHPDVRRNSWHRSGGCHIHVQHRRCNIRNLFQRGSKPAVWLLQLGQPSRCRHCSPTCSPPDATGRDWFSSRHS